MSNLPKCPKCGSEYTYEDGNMFVCPECAHEWSKEAIAETGEEGLVVAAPALSSFSRPSSLESPGLAFRGSPARRDERSLDVRPFPPRPCARGIRASCSSKDAHGNVLHDGDTVTVIKDLKVKGSSSVVKVGTKVKYIRLVEGDHNIDCKIDGIGPMNLKSEFVKKT